ncbi:transporter substrate-binding domain-containing protein [Microbacterium sp. SA39]|uniref:transporter substrate-binding domain-containing protein n=1 Tax=Microbacterium sp. SA39 TaxID=1263625 RepID=UPI00061F6091|nr:transporter substrate-binding domain-containing protein [Microbacterium sp. SA39]KJQ53346.1 Bacterial extracellular solute-binding protein, family 3 [Microbacterium sp. SA39]
MKTSPRSPRLPRTALVIAALALCGTLAGCGLSIPTDPDGTLDAVTGSELRVGTSPDGDLVEVRDGEPSGSIVELVDEFADSIRAETDWTVASEETLVTMLEAGDLDLIAGGITADTPWVERAGVSRGYPGIEGADGREIVMLVPLGENAFLSTLETFLDEEVGR